MSKSDYGSGLRDECDASHVSVDALRKLARDIDGGWVSARRATKWLGLSSVESLKGLGLMQLNPQVVECK